MSGVVSPETVLRRQLAALVKERPPTWQYPTFPVRQVRPAALAPGDVVADPVDGTALTVIGVWRACGAVVAYVRDADATDTDATARLRWTPRELVARTITAPAATTGRAVHPGSERTTR